jgi:hypothetical protein
MGGWTKLQLKDTSEENIAKHNQMLVSAGVIKKYRFYSEEDVLNEFVYFKRGEGAFPENQFPKDKIKSFNDFKKHWNTKALGEVFCPPFGSLTFDCYYSRTSKRAMCNMKNYIINALLLPENFMNTPFSYAEGSWSTFLERCGASKLNLALINEKIKEK